MKTLVCVGIALLIALSTQAQNLFTSDGSGNIYVFTPGGAQSTFASGLASPQGLAFNNAGYLFVSDSSSGNIYEFTPVGVRSTFASGLNKPGGLAFNSAGILFEADYGSGNIYEFTPGGAKSTFASGLSGPFGLACNSDNLFVGAHDSGNIYKFTPSRVKSTFASGLKFPLGLAFNSSNVLFEADFGPGYINAFTLSGSEITYNFTGILSGGPDGLAFNSAGVLFMAYNSGYIFDYTPPRGPVPSTFASGLTPKFLAFQPVVDPSYNQISCQLLSGGDACLSFVGIAGANYALDRSSCLSPANWVPQLTNTAGSFGVLVFTNTPDTTTNNFWRIRSVP